MKRRKRNLLFQINESGGEKNFREAWLGKHQEIVWVILLKKWLTDELWGWVLLFPVLAEYDPPSWHSYFPSLFQQTSGFPLSAKLILSGWQVTKIKSFNLDLYSLEFTSAEMREKRKEGGLASGRDNQLYSSSLKKWFGQRTKLMERTSNTKLKLGYWFALKNMNADNKMRFFSQQNQSFCFV